MSTHKYIDAICVAIVSFTLLLTVLFMNGKALGITVTADEDNSGEMFTENDQNAAWDTSNATKILLSDAGCTVTGNGAYADGSSVHIVYAGKYVVSGELSDGQIIVEADGDDKIWLMLSGASIHCEDNAAIRIEQAGKVFLTLQDGTDNVLSSGAVYSAEAVSAKVDGVIYSRDDLTVNGGGSLRIAAEYRHGIVCNDDLVFVGGRISVSAAQDGFHANDSVRIKESDITISAGDDGITVSNDDETAFLYIESGNLSIPSCYEGLEAVQITVAGGVIDITSSDDGINAGGRGGSSAIYITGGEITITNPNGRDADGIDSNKDIFISGGKLIISVAGDGSSCAIDYGEESGGVCEISGGTVLACGSSGMAAGFDSSSAQGFIMVNTSAGAGTPVTVKSADGDVLLSETVPYSFSSLIVSAPGMKVGDTYTLAVGETETVMTVDNVSNSGGFGGGRMQGGKGFGGMTQGQRPAGQNKGSDGMQPPEMPDGADGEDGLFNFPHGGMNDGVTPPDFPQDEIKGGGLQADAPQGNRDFGGRTNGKNMQWPNDGNRGNAQNQENAFQKVDTASPVSSEALLLIGISAILLLAGCAAAFFYRRRG